MCCVMESVCSVMEHVHVWCEDVWCVMESVGVLCDGGCCVMESVCSVMEGVHVWCDGGCACVV